MGDYSSERKFSTDTSSNMKSTIKIAMLLGLISLALAGSSKKKADDKPADDKKDDEKPAPGANAAPAGANGEADAVPSGGANPASEGANPAPAMPTGAPAMPTGAPAMPTGAPAMPNP